MLNRIDSKAKVERQLRKRKAAYGGSKEMNNIYFGYIHIDQLLLLLLTLTYCHRIFA